MRSFLLINFVLAAAFSYAQSNADIRELSSVSVSYSRNSRKGTTYNGVTIKSPNGDLYFVTPLSSLGVYSSLEPDEVHYDSLPNLIWLSFNDKRGNRILHVQSLKDDKLKTSKLLTQKNGAGRFFDVAVIPLSNLDSRIDLHYLEIANIESSPSFSNNEKLKVIGFSSDNGALHIMDVEIVFASSEFVGFRGDIYTLSGLLGSPVYKMSGDNTLKLLSFINGIAKTNKEPLSVSALAGCIIDILKDK